MSKITPQDLYDLSAAARHAERVYQKTGAGDYSRTTRKEAEEKLQSLMDSLQEKLTGIRPSHVHSG